MAILAGLAAGTRRAVAATPHDVSRGGRPGGYHRSMTSQPPPPPPAVAPAPPTVVLLHGLGRTSRAMRPLERAARARGYRVLNVGYPSRDAGVEAHAAHF